MFKWNIRVNNIEILAFICVEIPISYGSGISGKPNFFLSLILFYIILAPTPQP